MQYQQEQNREKAKKIQCAMMMGILNIGAMTACLYVNLGNVNVVGKVPVIDWKLSIMEIAIVNLQVSRFLDSDILKMNSFTGNGWNETMTSNMVYDMLSEITF